MKKKIYLLLSLVLMSICVIGANAEGEVAQIGDVKYATVAEAFAAVGDGETIELLADASFDNVVAYNGTEMSFTLDGNGNTLTATESIAGWDGGPQGSIRVLTAHIIVQDITLTQTNPDAKGFFEVRNNLGSGKSSLTVGDNVTFSATGGTAIQCSKAQSNRPELIISGSNVLIEGYSTGIDAANADITISGDVTITAGGTPANGIRVEEGTLTAEDGTLAISGFANGILLDNSLSEVSLGAGTTIKDCAGEGSEANIGIYVKAGILNFGGTIENCLQGIRTYGTVNMTDGEISGCNTRGISIAGGTVNVSGGEISGCAEGINIWGGEIEFLDGTVSGCTGNGIHFNSSGASGTIEGGVIGNCNYGIRITSGTVSMTDGEISGCTAGGIGMAGGALDVSGGTIEGCKDGINTWGANEIEFSGGTISDCTGSGIFFNNSNAVGTITGGEISGCATGININTTKVTMSGSPVITGNTTNVWLPAAGKITLEGEFTGDIRIKTNSDDASQITERLLVGEDFVSIADATSVVNDYHREQTVYLKDDRTFAWTKTPVFGIGTDGGVYTLTEDGEQLGVIRFITTLVDGIESDAVEYLGTYALSGADFELEAPEGTGPTFEKFENVTLVKEKRNSYIVDAIKIPAEHFSTTVSGISFVKIKGIAAPVFKSATTSVDSFNKNLGVNAESDFEAVAEEVSE